MGLDMYLYAEKYTSKYTESVLNQKLKVLLPDIQFDENVCPIYIKAQVGYWRKSNQIHKWFVDNVQNGVDDCRDYYVSKERLKQLRDLCVEVLANRDKAEESLPTQSGFFYGCVGYDEYYFSDLQDTIKIIDNALNLDENYSFVYGSSW